MFTCTKHHACLTSFTYYYYYYHYHYHILLNRRLYRPYLTCIFTRTLTGKVGVVVAVCDTRRTVHTRLIGAHRPSTFTCSTLHTCLTKYFAYNFNRSKTT